MNLRYHYSILASFLFLLLGCAFLFVAFDLLFFHSFIREAAAPPFFVVLLILFFGVLVSSGFFINLIKGKDHVIEADTRGVTVHTKSITNSLPKVFIPWSDVRAIEVKKVHSALNANRNDHKTSAICITLKKDLIEWPSVMIAKNRISFKKQAEADELLIDAWLNKKKTTIVKELKDLGVSVNPHIV
jgi:hypothetical protein